jgi:hypothetical protein
MPTREPPAKPKTGLPEPIRNNDKAERPRFEALMPPKILKPAPFATGPNAQELGKGNVSRRDNPPNPVKNKPDTIHPKFIMQDDPRTPNPGPVRIIRNLPRSKFTTGMRERCDTKEVYNKVLLTDVTLPLGEFLAVCPEIEKSLSSDTRLRTVPVTQANSKDLEGTPMEMYTQAHSPEDSDIDPSEYESIPESLGYYYRHKPYKDQQIGLGAVIRKKYRNGESEDIASTGTFPMAIGDVDDIRAVVDSGAGVGVVTPQLAAGLEITYAQDHSGKDFSLKNVSGRVDRLKGKFNNLPVIIGGLRFDETFFIGEDWNSHFDVILGQTFLRRYKCDLCWNGNTDERGNELITLHLFPNGDRDRRPLVVNLETQYIRPRHMAKVQMGIAEAWRLTDSESQGESSSNPIYEQQTSEQEMTESSSESDDTDNPKLPLKRPTPLPSTSESDFADISVTSDSDNDTWLKADTSTVNYTFSALYGNRESLGAMFNIVQNDYQGRRYPTAYPISFRDAQMEYHEKSYNAIHHLPLGDTFMAISEGKHDIRINEKPFRMVLNSMASYNVMSYDAMRRAGLSKIRSRIKYIDTSAWLSPRTDLEYCINVPIDLGSSAPDMPGTFALVDKSHLGDFDLICGKPWMIGIDKHYQWFKFKDNDDDDDAAGNDTESEQGYIVVEPSSTSKKKEEEEEEDDLWVPVDHKPNAMASGSSVASEPQTNDDSNMAEPSHTTTEAELGGSFAKAL